MPAGGAPSASSAVPPSVTVQLSEASSGSLVDRKEELEMGPDILLDQREK